MTESRRPRGIIVELRAKREGADFSKIVVDMTNGQRVDLSDWSLAIHHSVVDEFRDEFVDYIARYGMSSLMGREPLLEALVAKGTSSSALVPLLHGFLSALAVTTDLVVVDPYFLAKIKDASEAAAYPQLITQVLQPVLPTLSKLTIVTLPNKVDTTVSAAVLAALAAAAPNLAVHHKTSGEFHDRFWIDPIGGKGFLTGTSLNGLGKRYALVDHLQQTDAADVIAALRTEQLL